MNENSSYEKEKSYLILLMKASIDENTPPQLPDSLNWEKMFRIAEFHKVANLIWFGLEKSKNDLNINKDLLCRWEESRNKAIVREVLFNYEREAILNEMEKKGIRFLPLKGLWIKGYYPKIGMRWMSDNDILYDETRQEDVITIMENLGYQTISLKGNHDVFHKEKIFNFEMHRALFASSSPYYEYYKKIWDRAIRVENYQFAYRLSQEDAYVYYIAHLSKHWCGAGSGIRAAIDIYAFHKKNSFNRDYIDKQLESLKLLEFERMFVQLINVLFSETTPDKNMKEMVDYMFNSGVYGTLSNFVVNKIKLESGEEKVTFFGRMKYCYGRLFPDYGFMKMKYPILEKQRYLLPLAYLLRMSKALGQRKRLLLEAKIACKIKMENN